jgi:hypothetical protein
MRKRWLPMGGLAVAHTIVEPWTTGNDGDGKMTPHTQECSAAWSGPVHGMILSTEPVVIGPLIKLLVVVVLQLPVTEYCNGEAMLVDLLEGLDKSQ